MVRTATATQSNRQSFRSLAGDGRYEFEVLVNACRTISLPSSAVAAMIKSGIDGARPIPLSASKS